MSLSAASEAAVSLGLVLHFRFTGGTVSAEGCELSALTATALASFRALVRRVCIVGE